MVGFHYRVDDFYEVGREKVREYARAVQDFHPAHHDEDAAKGLGYDGLLAPLTFISLVGIIAQTRMFKEVITGYDPSQICRPISGCNFTARFRSAIDWCAMCTSSRSGR
jgi:hypothetical protein